MKNLIIGLAIISLLSLFGCTKGIYTNMPVIGSCTKTVDLTGKSGILVGKKIIDSSKLSYHGSANYGLVLKGAPVPLPNGFAHNDYCHKRPLFEALENGFTTIEADIFLNNDKLIVAHIVPYFKEKRTLEALYLQPLFERITKNNGKVFAGYNGPVTLMIDIKTNGEKTYNALKPLLEKYRSMLSGYENGTVVYRAVTIVLSGNKPYAAIENEQNRLAFIDEDLRKVTWDSVNNNVFSMASCKYSSFINWNGQGSFPGAERARLCRVVAMAHNMGVKVRLWASPENRAVWSELLSCGVDLINTDQLADLRNYLTTPQYRLPKTGDSNVTYAEVVSLH